MFRSAVIKLTIGYVIALFVVSLIFSVSTYVVSSRRLQIGAQRQTEILQGFDSPFSPRVRVLRDEQLQKDRDQLLRTLVVANLAVLSLGAYVSYRFARRTLRPIEEAHDMQTRFTTDASHELRTPLATMQAEIEVALRDKKFNSKLARKVLGSNLEEVDRLRNLSEQLLNLARLDSGQLQKTGVDLSKLIRDEIQKLEKRHNIAIKQTFADNVSVNGDKHLLRQLLDILVDNAVKYAGDKPADVDVFLDKKESTAQLTVTDRGIGIKASELPHIFDRFYRGSQATKHSSNGHGLGLSLVKQIVEAHDGTVTATSEPGKQTTFEITLPR